MYVVPVRVLRVCELRYLRTRNDVALVSRYVVGYYATMLTRGRRATREILEISGHIHRILGNRLEGNFGGIIPEFEEHN